MRLVTVIAGSILLVACTKSPEQPPAASPEPSGEEQPPDQPADDDATAERPGISSAECEEQGGKVVGDIGDGAIHRPEYRCPESGEPPIGTITAEPGGPVAVEGAVCCK